MLDRVSIIIPLAPDETAQDTLLKDLKGCGAEIIVSSEDTRAKSLNAGAKKAQKEFLWFLHADSRVTSENIGVLERCLKREPQALHYFFLKFGYGFAAFNAWGANVRSAFFALPYGDQGFCLSKDVFETIGGYPDTDYGEDVLFVRRAKKADVPLRYIPSKLRSSARKYYEQGWLKVTLCHQWMLFKLLRQKI